MCNLAAKQQSNKFSPQFIQYSTSVACKQLMQDNKILCSDFALLNLYEQMMTIKMKTFFQWSIDKTLYTSYSHFTLYFWLND